MGLSFSCPFAAYTDIETSLKSISLEDDEVKSLGLSCSFKIQDSNPTEMQIMSSQVMKIQGSLNSKLSSIDHVEKTEIPMEDDLQQGSPKHEAATKLQKVYKSFRTRRKLADCAVLIEQSWYVIFIIFVFLLSSTFFLTNIYFCRWKLLDFAELKRSSISFFDIDKQETAISRWSRARTRAAKVCLQKKLNYISIFILNK